MNPQQPKTQIINHTTPTAPKWVPIWGPFSEFGSPKGPHFFQGPHYIPFQAEECDKSQSSHYLLNVDNLNTCDDKTSLNLYTCTPNEATLFEGVFPHFFLLCISKKLARLDKFSKNRFLCPHLCWQRSPLGPHLTQNWVPIGSAFWTKFGPHGTLEQCTAPTKNQHIPLQIWDFPRAGFLHPSALEIALGLRPQAISQASGCKIPAFGKYRDPRIPTPPKSTHHTKQPITATIPMAYLWHRSYA